MDRRVLSQRRYFLVLFAVFAVSFLFRFVCADYLKVIQIYPDELRYYMIGESIASGRGISLYNAPTNFQKVLYSILLAPAFLVKDRLLTLRLIALINVAIMSSGVFPAALLGKKVSGSNKWGLFCAVCYAMLAELVYCNTFMAEVAYIPLALFLIYALFCFLDLPADTVILLKRLLLAFALGIATYALYLTKEVALAVPVALCLYTAVECLLPLSPEPRREKLYALVSYLIGFAMPFLLLKATLFQGLGNSYNQQSLDVLFQPGRFVYMLYSFVYYMGNVLVTFGVFPILLPLLLYRRLPASEKRLLRLLVLLFVVISGVIAYTISVREDFGELVPRTHIRYISFLFIPFLSLLLPCIRLIQAQGAPRALVPSAIVLCLFLPFYNGVRDGSSVDQMMAEHIRFLDERMSMPEFRFLLGAVVVISCILLLWRPKWFLPLFCTGFCMLQVFDNAQKMKMQRFTYSQYISEASVSEYMELRSFMAEHADEQFLMICSGIFDCGADTFLYLPNLRETYLEGFNLTVAGDNIDLHTSEIPINMSPEGYTDLDIQYLILPRTLVPVSDCGVPVLTLENANLYLYRLNETSQASSIGSVFDLVGNKFTCPLVEPIFKTAQILDDQGFVSSSSANYLVYGPFIYLPAGEYQLVFHYDTSGCTVPDGTVVGFVDANCGELKDPPVQVEFTAGSDTAVLENVVLLQDTERFETRIFTSAAGIRPVSVVITRVS